MRLLTTITLFLLAALAVTMSVFLAVDGNLARITGWYRFEPGMPLFSRENTNQLDRVCWMRLENLHEMIECSKDEHGAWWIEKPFRDRMAPQAAQAILSFTERATIVDTLPLNNTTRENMREFGVETSPHRITLKVKDGQDDMSTIARYTLGSASPWLADAGNGTDLLPTTYLRTDFYGRDKRIHVVSGNILGLFKDGLEALRDPRPLQFDAEELSALTIRREGEEEADLRVSRISAESGWTIDSPVLTAADDDNVNLLVRSLGNLTALRVEEQADVTLPAAPVYRITLELNGRQEELCLYEAFADKDAALCCYATVSSRPVVFVLPYERRIKRTGCYAPFINAVCKMPVLPEKSMAQVLANSNTIYAGELKMGLAELRSTHFSELEQKDIARVSLRDTRAADAIRLLLIPGNADSQVEDTWLFATQDQPYRKAETAAVQRLLGGMRDIPVEEVVADARPGERVPLEQYGLNAPDIILSVLPRPCVVRMALFGLDLPLVKDRQPRVFLLRRYPDPRTGKKAWFGAEMGGASVCRLSTKFTRLLSLRGEKWKERQLMTFPLSAVRCLTLDFQEAPLVLHYDYIGESWEGTLGGEDVSPRINPHRAEHYVRSLQKLKVAQWLEDDDEDALAALRHPAFTVKLDLEVTDYSAAESATIEQTEDDRADSETPEDMLGGTDEETDRRMLELATAEREVHKVTRTLQIAPSDQDSDKPFFYGRIVETGELFILPFADAQGLAGDMLDM